MLPVEKRQEILLQAAVSSESKHDDNIQYKSESIPFSLQNANGVKLENDKFIVENNGATVELLLNNKVTSGELYIILENIQFSGVNPYKGLIKDVSWKDKKRIDYWNDFLQYIQWKQRDAIQINIMVNGATKSISHLTPQNKYGYGRDSYICNMGYFSDMASNTIKLTFPIIGEYSYSDLRVVLQPLDNLTMYDENMYDTIWQRNDIVMNGMRSTVKLEKDGYIQFAIPYSKGWSVYVDGEERFLEQSSTLFMGMDMEKGEHIIELSYVSPGLKEGIIITFYTALIGCIWWIINSLKAGVREDG